MTLVKDSEADFIQDHCNRYRNLSDEITVGDRDWAQCQMQHKQVGIYS